jgi:hypothetical protein
VEQTYCKTLAWRTREGPEILDSFFFKVDFFKKNIRPRAPGFFGGKNFKVELKDSTELVARKRK